MDEGLLLEVPSGPVAYQKIKKPSVKKVKGEKHTELGYEDRSTKREAYIAYGVRPGKEPNAGGLQQED